MKPKLELSVSEMMQLRNDGYSNKDISRILDISLPTVYKYIGKQGCHIPSATLSNISNTISIALANGQSITIPADEVDKLVASLGLAREYMKQQNPNE